MKRSPALAPLSRDHHHGLVVAQRLARASEESADAARAEFLRFWEAEGRTHFQVEEELLLPAFERHGSADHQAVVRVLVEHVEIRRRAADLEADPSIAPDRLHDLGIRLQRHIRHEERVLFPLIEEALPEDELAELATSIERAESYG
jgi:hemerythrin-like domain-containing protein